MRIISGTWERLEHDVLVPTDYVTCDADGWIKHHQVNDDASIANAVNTVQAKCKAGTVWLFTTWRLLIHRSTDDKLIWSSQLSSRQRKELARNNAGVASKRVVWNRVTDTPQCDVFIRHVHECGCCSRLVSANL